MKNRHPPTRPQAHRIRSSRITRNRRILTRFVPIFEDDANDLAWPAQTFAEGASDALDAELRHRLISQAACRRLAECRYAEYNEIEDLEECASPDGYFLLHDNSNGWLH